MLKRLKKEIEKWFDHHYDEEKTYNISSKGRKGFTLKLMEDKMNKAPVWFTSYMTEFEKKIDDKISNLESKMNARFDKIESLPTIQKELKELNVE